MPTAHPRAGIHKPRGDVMAHRSVQGRAATRAAVGFGSLLVIGALVVAGCSSAGAPLFSGTGGTVDGQPAEAPMATAGPAVAPVRDAGLGGSTESGATGAKPGGGAPDVNAPSDSGPLIVRTGQLDLQVADVEAAIRAAESAVTAAGGYVAGSQRSGDTDKAYASVLFRIPAAHWTETLDALRKLGTKLLGETTSSQEVTSQVVDLGARLVNLRATETALQAIMARATKIADVLQVESQLSDVQGQIEQLSTQQAHLKDQASLATLSVLFALPPTPATVETSRGWDPGAQLDQASSALLGIGQALASAGIWLVVVGLPVGLASLILLGLVIFFARRLRRSGPPSQVIIPPAEG
jgi:hypothetical protein